MTPTLNPQYKGSTWVKCLGIEPSPLGEKVANILGVVYQGIYHIPEKDRKNIDWSNKDFIVVEIRRNLATYDVGMLTWLVVLCHDQCIRLDIHPSNKIALKLVFTQRTRDGLSHERMPTMEDHLKIIRDSQLYKNTFSGENDGNK